MISHIDVVTIYVEDQDRMAVFFVEALGFSKRTDAPMGPGRRWVEVVPEGARTALALLRASDFGRQPDDGYPVTFHCEQLDATGGRLGDAGVAVSDVVREPWGSYRTATDPEGRSLMLVQPQR